jgi:hypothetical protein
VLEPNSEQDNPHQNIMANRRCIKEVSGKKSLTLESSPEVFNFDYIADEETP